MLPCFTQSLGGCSLALLSRWRDAPSLHSVAEGMLPHLAQSLEGCSLALLSHWGDAPSLCSVAGGMLPRFAQSLEGCSLVCTVAGGRSLASLSHWGDAPSLRSVTGGCSLASLSCFPFNGSIKLLQNLHSRGSMKQHFYVWEPRCEYHSLIARTSFLAYSNNGFHSSARWPRSSGLWPCGGAGNPHSL